MKGKFRRVKIADLKKRPLRSDHGSEEDLKALAASWLKRAAAPIVVRPDLTVADGHRRLLGLELLGETEVTVFVTDENLNDDDLLEFGLETVLHRADLSPFDQATTCREWFKIHPEASFADLGKRIGRDPSMVMRLMSLWKTSAATEAAAKDGSVTCKAWYQISQLPEAERDSVLAMYTSKMPAAQVESLCKKKRAPVTASNAVKQSKITCPLTTGTKVVVSGPEMSLSDLIDALQTALEAARKANKESLDVRTFEKVLKDKAKAG